MNIAVAQSGGPTAAINASLAGVFVEAVKNDEIKKVYGFKNGIEGVLRNDAVDLSEYLSDNRDIEVLKLTPSTVLGSCRLKLKSPEENEEQYKKILEVFESLDIGAFFYIGGNDSMDTVLKLSDYFKSVGKDIKVMGIPKTIDNDLVLTDHTPGFGSAAKYIATTVSEIIRDSQVYALTSVTVIEIMGRDAGWLTAATSVLRRMGEDAPHLIYLPEVPVTKEKILEEIKDAHNHHKACIVAVSEGIKTPDGKYLAEDNLSGCVDVFGHKYLSGVGKYLENLISTELSCKVRSVELNVMQRCSSHLASLTDIDESQEIGSAAVRYALLGHTGEMMVFVRKGNNPYAVEISSADIKDIANKEKLFPREWINEKGNNIKDEAIDYFMPLIQGEVNLFKENGLPVHLRIK